MSPTIKAVSLLAFIILCGCKPNATTHPYAQDWNPERIKRNIRTLPEHAVYKYTGEAGEEWHDPNQDSSKNCWGGKEIELKSGKILSEADIFYGPAYHDPADGPEFSRVYFRYDYSKEAAGKNPWQITVWGKIGGKVVSNEQVPMDEGRSILNTWGLTYGN